MMKLKQVEDVFDEVIGDLPILYHLDVTTPTTPVRKIFPLRCPNR